MLLVLLAGLVAATGDAALLEGLPAPLLGDPLEAGPPLEDAVPPLADPLEAGLLLLAGALLLDALLLAGALSVAVALLLELLEDALRLRLELLPAEKLLPSVETEPTGASEVGVPVGLAAAGLLLESLATACPGSSPGLLPAGWRTIRNPPVARAATSNATAAASGPRPPNRLRRGGWSSGGSPSGRSASG